MVVIGRSEVAETGDCLACSSTRPSTNVMRQAFENWKKESRGESPLGEF